MLFGYHFNSFKTSLYLFAIKSKIKQNLKNQKPKTRNPTLNPGLVTWGHGCSRRRTKEMLSSPRLDPRQGALKSAQTCSDPRCSLTSDSRPSPYFTPLAGNCFSDLPAEYTKGPCCLPYPIPRGRRRRRGYLPSQGQLCGLPKGHPH